jgi:hypothetical protein
MGASVPFFYLFEYIHFVYNKYLYFIIVIGSIILDVVGVNLFFLFNNII